MCIKMCIIMTKKYREAKERTAICKFNFTLRQDLIKGRKNNQKEWMEVLVQIQSFPTRCL